MSMFDRRIFPALAASAAAAPVCAQATEPLTIRTASGGAHRFEVEVATTDLQRSLGLMHRRHMPADRGMIFDFERDGDVSMWMRNTYIALDMLFIRANGVIHRIAHRTEPLSDRTIPSGGSVRSVLEINGGLCEKFGIAAGDRVEHRLFKG